MHGVSRCTEPIESRMDIKIYKLIRPVCADIFLNSYFLQNCVLTDNTEVYSHKMQYSIRQNKIKKTRLEIHVKNLHEPTY